MSDAMDLVSTMPTFRTCDPLTEFVAVSVTSDCLDEAIDMTESKPGEALDRIDKYRTSRNLHDLKWKHGARPVQFVLRQIPILAKKIFESTSEISAMNAKAFCASCHEIIMEDGRVLKPEPSTLSPLQGVSQCLIANEQWMQTVTDEVGDCIDEMGYLALRYSGLKKAKRQRFGFSAG